MGIKIKQLNIVGLRGVTSQMGIDLGEKSILVYGENGAGKSSISDAIEWYYTDRVAHLSISEIDLKEAMRNSCLAEDADSLIGIKFNKPSIDCEKKLSFQRGKLTPEFLNTTPDFKDYLLRSSRENLILRYQLLRDFIDKTKSDKLKTLSEIIGFSEVVKVKEILKRAYNSIKIEIKSQNYETQINTQKQTLIAKIGAAVSQEEHLFEKVNEILKAKKIPIEIKSIADIDKALNHLKTPANSKLVTELNFLNRCSDVFANLKSEIDFIDDEYGKYYTEFELIASDVQAIMQTFLSELLRAASAVIDKKYHKDNNCPLCLQPKNIEELRNEINARMKEIEESSKIKASFDKAKQTIVKIATGRLNSIHTISLEVLLRDAPNVEIKKGLDVLKAKISEYLRLGNEFVTSGHKLKKPEELKLNEADFDVLKDITSRIKAINESMKEDNSTVLYSNISAAKDAFLKIKKVEVEKLKLEAQQKSLKLIYDEFVKKQKEGLEDFINKFSSTINDYYQYMNPREQFEEIRIVTMGEEDELNGITIEYKYNDNWVSPPQKYFSESHLNCFGISFFLASVVAFNKENKFLILDDVISSFDTTHRKRFADLLFEKFTDWQIILLTHEEEWFQYVSQLAKKKSWLISKVKWIEGEGTCLDEAPGDPRELIEAAIAKGSMDSLGNPIRRYLESALKDICLNLDVKVSFKLNDTNEKRMPDELLNELKSRILKKSAELKAKIPIIDRVAGSALLGNLLSHDNSFNSKAGDIKAFWADVLELEAIFTCKEPACKKRKVALDNYDSVARKVRCGCDATKYDWAS